ncbi:hypothetical protein NDA16_000344 [Ustilago loliicola]|nr:hypothetical protein NDA16_000344 [Ustilago loliicola]
MGKSKKSAPTGEASLASSPKKSNEASIMLANGFLAVPVTIPHSKLSKSVGEVKHWIYVRKHTSSSSGASAVASTSKLSDTGDLPSERTLFIANLPTDTIESHLREVFAKAGNLSTVKFRRQAAKEEEEDEREEMGEGEDEVDEEDGDDEQMDEAEEHHQLAAQGKSGKKKKGAQAKKSRVPRIVPLPSLDPREAMGSQSFLVTSSSAHVVFLDTQSFSRAMDLLKNGIRWVDPFRSLRKEAEKQALLDEQDSHNKKRATTSASFLLSAGAGIPPTGLEYFLDQYSLSRPALPDIQAWTNSRIALYQYRKAHPPPRKIGVRGVTVGPSGELLDEDGFIIVQRSGKYGRAGASAEGGGSVGVARHDFKENTKKKSVGLDDFYRFQLREKKREQLADLRAKFEADKEKVAKLKAGRRFKPY